MSESANCCRCCFSFLLTLGLTALFLWLSFRANNPSCSIKNFYLPALNRSLNSPDNDTIFMDLRLKNSNSEKGIYYDPVNVTVSYFQDPNRTLWYGQVPRFYQGHQKKATKNVSVVTLGVNWTDVIARNESTVFRVNLTTQVRFKILAWKTKRHKVEVGANVTVNYSGAKESGVLKYGRYCGQVGIFLGILAFGLLHL